MNDRHKGYVRRRSSVLDDDQKTGTETSPSLDKPPRRDHPFKKIIPLLIFTAIAFLIAKEEIPAVSNAWERMVSPENWLAKQTCQRAAMERSERNEFARLLKPGKVNKTNKGIYIDRLVVGEMGQSGDEVSVEYSCYLDSEGKLVKLNRIEPAPVSDVPESGMDVNG